MAKENLTTKKKKMKQMIYLCQNISRTYHDPSGQIFSWENKNNVFWQ